MGGNNSKNGFGWNTTAEQAIRDVDLNGKNVLVTGGNAGIGVETARVLASHGANVIIACRDLKKGEKTIENIRSSHPDAKLLLLLLDLSSLSSIRQFVTSFKEKYDTLHILINNAGVMATPYKKTVDGFELQFGTNHLGHFLLTNLLINELARGAPSRVVVVASKAHEMFGGPLIWDDLQAEKSYSPMKAYGYSKTANILFAMEFNKRYEARGIYTNAIHPGMIKTELTRNSKIMEIFSNTSYALGFAKNVYQGAATSVYVATAPELEKVGGKYFNDCNEDTARPYATNPEDAARLWDVSAQLVGLVDEEEI